MNVIAEILANTQDGPFWWEHGGGWKDIDKIKAPVLNLVHTPNRLHAMYHLRSYASIRSPKKLIITPWTNENYQPWIFETTSFNQHILRWLDYWLKGQDTGIMGEPAAKLFLMGANRWVDENEWPIARTRWTKFYLHSGGRANSFYGDGTLSLDAPQNEPQDRYTSDPAQPVPFITEPSFAQIRGPDDYRPVERRDDVLVYSSSALEKETEVCGPIRVELYAASSARDADFMAKLVDVWPNGFAERLSDGMVRARFREGMDRPSLIEPERVYRYNIDAWNTCQMFLPGHRIRLEIASSAAPKYDANPQTGEPLGKTATVKTAEQRIYHDREHPSLVTLPVAPER